MFQNGYNSEKAIKKWAVILRAVIFILLGLSFLAAIIVAAIDFEYLWWISLIILGGAGIIGASLLFASDIVYGFAEIVGSTKRMSGESSASIEEVGDTLPEL